MRYSQEEALREILRRGEILARKRRHRSVRLLSGACLVLSALLVAAVWQAAGMSATGAGGSVYGSYLLSEEGGGYVLTGVIAFILGIVFTLFCLHLRNKRQDKFENKEKEMGDQP